MLADLQVPAPRVEQSDDHYARVAIGPLDAAMGLTVGTMLRRMLLSSIRGAAITSARIDGVEHEFTVLEHVLEDVSELLTNLSHVRFKMYAARPARLFLDARGEREVRAVDITSTADYEVANPDLHIATLTDPEASLVVDLNVEAGHGFAPAHRRSEGMPIGVIPIDAIFSPIRRVNCLVKASSGSGGAGKDEELVLDVWTDGAIDGIRAISEAAALLSEQFGAITEIGTGNPSENGSGAESWSRDGWGDGRPLQIEELGLPARVYNALRRANLLTVPALFERSQEDLLSLRNFGSGALKDLTLSLRNNGAPAPWDKQANGAAEDVNGQAR